MKRIFPITLLALLLSSTVFAAKGGNPPCDPRKPSLDAPTDLVVVGTDSSIDATWSGPTGASKWSVDVRVHYLAADDVHLTFSVFEPEVSIPLVELATETCVEDECTTHDAIAVELRVKGLNPPTKGKDSSQCNPFTASCTIDVCGDGIDGDDDSETDEDCDNDGDGYVTGSLSVGCSPGGDCNDGDDTINPGATEDDSSLCFDTDDNDCDGDTDCADSDCFTFCSE